MQQFGNFLHMGGYAVFVWSAYGLSVLVLVWNVWAAVLRERRLLQELARSAPGGRRI